MRRSPIPRGAQFVRFCPRCGSSGMIFLGWVLSDCEGFNAMCCGITWYEPLTETTTATERAPALNYPPRAPRKASVKNSDRAGVPQESQE